MSKSILINFLFTFFETVEAKHVSIYWVLSVLFRIYPCLGWENTQDMDIYPKKKKKKYSYNCFYYFYLVKPQPQ